MHGSFLFDLDWSALLPALLAALAAGLARGFAGFGSALIFMPVASATLGPTVAAPVLLLADMALTLSLIPNAFRVANRREVAIMAVGAVVGIPMGAFLLTHVPATPLRWAIVVIVGMMLALLASGWHFKGKPRAPLTIGVGWMAGLFSGAAQIGGPPIVAYWLGGTNPPVVIRGNIILYFQVSSLISTLSYAVAGLFGWHLLPLVVAVAPTYALGLTAGSYLFKKRRPPLLSTGRLCPDRIRGSAGHSRCRPAVSVTITASEMKSSFQT